VHPTAEAAIRKTSPRRPAAKTDFSRVTKRGHETATREAAVEGIAKVDREPFVISVLVEDSKMKDSKWRSADLETPVVQRQ
jgi:hypothetical protein